MITLTPAYGRDYKNKQQVTEAWQDGYDFIVNQWGHKYDGKPVRRAQLDGIERQVKIRYGNLRKVIVLDV